MAKYFIFNKDYANDPGAIVRIAESDDALSKSHINIDLYKVIAVTDDVFSNFRKLVYVSPQYDDSDNITYIDISSTHSFLDVEDKNHIDYNQWNTFKTNISNIDASSYTYPLVKTVPQLLEDLSQPYYNLLELI